MDIKMAKRLRILNFLTFVLNIALVYLGNNGTFGDTASTISSKYPTILTPASWAFSIWLVIFAYEGIMCIAQLFEFLVPSRVVSDGLSIWFILANLFQGLWAVFFSRDLIVPASVAIVLIWLSLTKIMKNLHTLRESYYKGSESFISFPSILFVVLPISIHYAWVTIATAISMNILVLSQSGASVTESTRILMALLSISFISAIAFSHALVMTSPDFLVPLTCSWASLAIAYKLEHEKVIDDYHSPAVKDSFRNLFELYSIIFVALSAYALLKSMQQYAFTARNKKLIYIKQNNETLPTFDNRMNATPSRELQSV